MARKRQLQTTFIAGELAPDLGMRVDTKQYANGAKSLLNRRCLIGGGTSRRPGTRDLIALFGQGIRLVEFIFNENEQYILAFSWEPTQGGVMVAYLPDGSYAGGFTGAPWNDAITYEMDWMQTANTVIVTHSAFRPQVITRVGPASWTLHPIEFFASGPRLEQPYFKLAPHTCQLAPSGYTGSISLINTCGYFRADHIGQRIRYLGREILITSVSDGTNATGDVIERLPPSFVLGVADGSIFTEGETVAGSDSGAKGVIVSITANELLVYSRNASITSSSGPGGATSAGLQAGLALGFPGVDPFALTGQVGGVSLQAFTVGETLVGPVSTSKIIGVANVTPAAVPDWDEALFTDGNGYPSCVALHRNRLCFGGHPRAPNLFMASRLGNIYSFQVGDGSDADAILVTIGDAAAAEIRQIFSTDQLLLATDKGLYYVPEGPNQPFRPSSMAFVNFGSPWPISGKCKLRLFDDGVIAVSGSTVIKAKGTGNTQQTWGAQEVSLLSPHLVKDPYDMAVTTNFEGGPERYCVFNNIDGTLAVMMLVEGQDIRNFVPWATNGFFGSICVVKKRLYTAAAQRGGSNAYHLELFDNTLTLDGVKDIGSQGELGNVPFMFPNRTVNVVTFSGYSLGTYPLKMDDVPLGPYHIGDNYPTVIQTLAPAIDDPRGSISGEIMKISEALVFTLESARFAGNGYEKQAYLVNEDANLPPPRRTGPQRLRFLGWRREPTLTITQPDPLPLTVLAVKTEVLW